MKALIVDDEHKASEILDLLIKVHIPEINQTRIAANGPEATGVLKEFTPNIVFLDIRMPGQNGFEWLASLSQRPFDVIFTTAYDQYAIQAIRYSAFDYLVKPVDPEDLRNAMDRFKGQPEGHHDRYENLLFNITQQDTSNFRLTVATTEGTYYIDHVDIIRCEADGNYTHFYLKNARHIMTSRSLGHYSSILPEVRFIRCHKSHLVNLDHIESISDKKILLKDGTNVEVSRRRMASVKSALSH